jgi:hypothetical protein
MRPEMFVLSERRTLGVTIHTPRGVSMLQRVDESRRSAILDQELLRLVSQGAGVVARIPTSAVVAFGKPVNHVLRLLATVLLCGLWLPVWVIIAATGGERRQTVAVDEYGEVYDPNPHPSTLRPVLITLGIAVAILLFAALISTALH